MNIKPIYFLKNKCFKSFFFFFFFFIKIAYLDLLMKTPSQQACFLLALISATNTSQEPINN